jgi:hypothetical protein
VPELVRFIAKRQPVIGRLPFSSMVLRITRLVPAPSEPTLVTSSGPKRREKASCTSSVTSWPRKTMTECSSNAARVALYAASSAATSASVMPRNSAAKPGPSGMISIGEPSVAWIAQLSTR